MKGFEAATIEFLTSLSEAKLQARIVEPLLRLQGFTHVRDTSGPNDKGKDLVAVTVEFGKTKLYAIQLKRFRFSGKHTRPNALTNVLCSVPRFSRGLSPDRFVWNRGVVPSCGVKTSSDWAVEILPNDVVRMFSQ